MGCGATIRRGARVGLIWRGGCTPSTCSTRLLLLCCAHTPTSTPPTISKAPHTIGAVLSGKRTQERCVFQLRWCEARSVLRSAKEDRRESSDCCCCERDSSRRERGCRPSNTKWFRLRRASRATRGTPTCLVSGSLALCILLAFSASSTGALGSIANFLY